MIDRSDIRPVLLGHFTIPDDGSDEEIKVPTWIERIRELDPVEVLFAHDTAIWRRDR